MPGSQPALLPFAQGWDEMIGGRRRQQPMPPEPDGPELKWPGAANRVDLFAQVIWVGILTTLSGLPLLTIPAALAAGNRHLHRYLRGERSTVKSYASDFVRALPGGLLVGVAAAALATLLGLNIFLATAQVLFAWPVILAVGVAAAALAVVALLQIGSHWAPGVGWWVAARMGVTAARRDLLGGVLILAVTVLAAVAAWLLPPLAVVGLGCVLFTVLAVNERQHRSQT